MNKALLLLLIMISLLFGQQATTIQHTVSLMPKLELTAFQTDSFLDVIEGTTKSIRVRIGYLGSPISASIIYPSVNLIINGQDIVTDSYGTAFYTFSAVSSGTYTVLAQVNTTAYPEFIGRNQVEFTIKVDGDNDNDGILNYKDNCPDNPEDFDGIYDDDGCPEIDGDNDGIVDESDNCPTSSEDYDGFNDSDGCPDPVNIMLTVEENVDGECMEGRNLSFSATFDPTSVVGDPAYNLKFNYLGADGVTQLIEDWSWDNIEEKSVAMPNVLDGDEDHYNTTVAEATLFTNEQLNSTSNQIYINVYKLWIKDVIESSENKTWYAVVGEPFESSAIASKDCNGWVWDMYDNGIWESVEPVTPNYYGQTATLQIRTSKLPTAENWNFFGEAYGTLNAWCLDGEGNIHQINSTDQESTLKIKVFYDPDLINPHTTTSNPTPNCFYYWQEAYFGGLSGIKYDPSRIYSSYLKNTQEVIYGDLTNNCYKTPFDYESFLRTYSPSSIPYRRNTADGKSEVDLFYCIISHELQHMADFQNSSITDNDDIYIKLEYKAEPFLETIYDSPEPNHSPLGWFNYTVSPWFLSVYDLNDELSNIDDYYSSDINGAWRHSNDFVKYNEYRNWSLDKNSWFLYLGDFEYNAREIEWLTAPIFGDWSKGGKQW